MIENSKQIEYTFKGLSSELFLIVYFFMFVFVKPLNLILGKQIESGFLLYVLTSIILVVFFLKNNCVFYKKNSTCFLGIVGLFSCLFILTFLLNGNSQLVVCFKQFLINGIIPLMLIINVKSYGNLLYYWSLIGQFSGIIAILDLSFKLNMFEDYMVLGYECLLPAIACVLIQFMYYKCRISLLGILIYFPYMLIYTNKGTSLTAIVLFFVLYIITNSKKSKYRTIIIFGSLISIWLLREGIIKLLVDYAKKRGIESYSINTLAMMLKSSDKVFSLRTGMWDVAKEYINQRPLFGYGIGYFAQEYGIYPHNIILEMSLSFGVILTVMLLIYLTVKFFSIIRSSSLDYKILIFTFFILWFIPLSISLSFWQYMPFWIFCGLLIYQPKEWKKRRNS